jgi:lipid A 3-O-deacylase
MRRVALVAVLAGAFVCEGCVGGAMTLYEENDILSIRGRKDGYYSQGARISRVFPATDGPSRDFATNTPIYEETETNAVGFVLGQNIYTPRDVEHPLAQEVDRPYAGWLYAGVVFGKQKIKSDDRTDDDQQTIEVDVGVTGEPSLAHDAQEFFHRTTGSNEPQGWKRQVQFEPGVVVSYERRHRVVSAAAFDLMPSYGGSVGNIDTHFAVGATARLGLNLPRDFGVNTIATTAMETASSGADGPSFYLFGSGEERLVLRNVFLDGNTWRDSPHTVEKDVGVAEFRGGFAVQYKAFRFTYAWITRSPEFHGQHGWQRFGSASLGLFLEF